MSVTVDSIKFQDEFTGNQAGGNDQGASKFMACVGDLIYVVIKCHVGWSLQNANTTFRQVDNSISLNGFGLSFLAAGFKAGDTFTITNAGANNGNYTINTISASVITTTTALPSNGSFSGANFYGTTTVNGMDFYYNILGGNEGINFSSKTDKNTLQKFSGLINNGYYSNSALSPNTTSQAWYVSSVNGITCVPTVINDGVLNYNQNFIIVFPVLVTPLFLSDQLPLLQSALTQTTTSGVLNVADFTPPSYFINDCLNFIYQIDAKFDITNSVVDHSSYGNVNFGKGNTAWFNQFFPTGVKYNDGSFLNTANYWTKSIGYADQYGNTISSIDINNPTTVTIVVGVRTGGCSVGDPFVVNFMGLPQNQGTLQGYQFIAQGNYREVFLHDRCKTSIGAGSSNGDQYGTTVQAITNVTSVRNSTGLFTVTFTVSFGSLSNSVLASLTPNNANYLIWITPQKQVVTTLAQSNRSAIICDVNTAFVNTDDPTGLVVNTNGSSDILYFDTETNDLTNKPYTDAKMFSGGYGIWKCGFGIKQGYILQTVQASFEVDIYQPNYYYYASQQVSSFILESWTKSLSASFDGNKSRVGITETRGYNLPASDKRNRRAITQIGTPLNAVAGYNYYEIDYGFQADYKWWINLFQAAPEFEQFSASYWALYTQGYTSTNIGTPAIASGFGSNIKFKLTWLVLNPSTGATTTFIQSANTYVYDDGNNAGGASCVLDTTDISGYSLSGVVPNDSQFLIQATFTSLAGFAQYSGKVELILYYNNGVREVFDRISTTDGQLPTNSAFKQAINVSYSPDGVTLIATVLASVVGSSSIKNCNIFAKLT